MLTSNDVLWNNDVRNIFVRVVWFKKRIVCKVISPAKAGVRGSGIESKSLAPNIVRAGFELPLLECLFEASGEASFVN